MTRGRDKKAVKNLTKAIENIEGVTVEKAKRSGHFKVRLHGRTVGGFPSTPSESRGMLNAVADLRRAGIPIPRNWRNGQ